MGFLLVPAVVGRLFLWQFAEGRGHRQPPRDIQQFGIGERVVRQFCFSDRGRSLDTGRSFWRVANPPIRQRMATRTLAIFCLLACNALAEQKVMIGEFAAHYVVFPSAFLSAEVANTYDITRARGLSIVNLSVLGPDGKGAEVELDGNAKNLLGQLSPLKFREVREGEALYYLAEVRHTNREVLRFSIAITPSGERTFDLKFQQELFWEE